MDFSLASKLAAAADRGRHYFSDGWRAVGDADKTATAGGGDQRVTLPVDNLCSVARSAVRAAF
ncbi:hypothetical protein PANT111_130174 [Pantoea brenneri]|uniref:Uncharacterized protein n=1 Tax=Pantoea brenneri TaxID=472694 RepID=A0AAX3J2M1_9GAMM|nr:hypothetical protein PANT111_130174 [Pantoea brenneri]